jgi:assimilatory nitrate reductase catalytic subunit
VRDNQVIGFEPWEDFPFNKGMLCPQGRQALHAERPSRPAARAARAHGGRLPKAPWEEALDLTARRLREIQEKHGKDAVAIYGGASLTTEKSYLLGKFARVALGTRHIDYNGRLCMVSAGTAYKLAYGVDRSPNPWADIPLAQVVMVTGSNVAECSPITTSYLWQMRENGGRLIVVDPRMTPITRGADLYLPVRPGTDLALHHAILHVILRDHLEKRDYIDAHTTGLRGGGGVGEGVDSGAGGGDDGRAPGRDREGGALDRGGGPRDGPARARDRAPGQGCRELPVADQHRARHRQRRTSEGRAA